ncbi:hypothetical protein [Dactylosporangium sp. NPDC000521]|uniref:hypothetical protein n=1 Tax=Dactylosporangium sp. NPDC000521 TaxID=3363975 RepID=UPI0036794FB5
MTSTALDRLAAADRPTIGIELSLDNDWSDADAGAQFTARLSATSTSLGADHVMLSLRQAPAPSMTSCRTVQPTQHSPRPN